MNTTILEAQALVLSGIKNGWIKKPRRTKPRMGRPPKRLKSKAKTEIVTTELKSVQVRQQLDSK